jgi:hypothetical protein
MSVSRKVQMGAGGSGGDPWSLESVSYAIGSGKNNHLGPQDLISYSPSSQINTLPVAIDFNLDGTIAFVLTYNATANDLGVTSYTLGTPYDLTTAVVLAGGQPTGTSSWNSTPTGAFRFTPDGTRAHIINNSNVYQFAFSTAWDVTTMSQEATYPVSGYGPAFVWNDDGTIMYVYDDSTGAAIAPITLTSPYDFLSGYSIGTSYTFSNSSFLPSGMDMFDFSHDGTVLYTAVDSFTGAGSLNAVAVTTPYDLSTIDDTDQSSRDATGTRVLIPSTGGRIISDGSSVRLFGAWYNTAYAGYYGFNGRGISCSVANEGPDPATNSNAFEWEFRSSVYAPQYDAGGNLSSLVYSTGTDSLRDFWFQASGNTLNTFRTQSSSDPGSTTQNTLSNAYDVGSVSSLGTTSIFTPSGNSLRVRFMDDGNKFFVFNPGSVGYLQTYTTSIPYDVSSSATKTSIGALYFSSQSYAALFRILWSIYSVSFNDDGTEMYLGYGSTSNNLDARSLAYAMPTQVIKITLSTPWNPSTGDWTGMPWIVDDQGINNSTSVTTNGFEWNSTGTAFYTQGTEFARWWTAYPQTAYHVDVLGNFSEDTTLFGTNNYFNIIYNNCESIQFNPDGTRFYVYDYRNSQITQIDLSTPYDVPAEQASLVDYSRAPGNTMKRVDGGSETIKITLNPTGTKVYRLTNGNVYEYTLSTAWDLGSASTAPTASLVVETAALQQGDIVWGDNGTKLYRLGRYSTTILYPFIEQYSASIAYDLGSVNSTPVAQIGFYPQTGSTSSYPIGFRFNPTGTRILVSWTNYNANTEGVSQLDLTTAWDITTAPGGSTPYATSAEAAGLLPNDIAYDLEFNSTGTVMYFGDGHSVREYSLSSAWDISSTLTQGPLVDFILNGYPHPSSGFTSGPGGFVFADGGTKLFKNSSNGAFGALVRFDFSTAYDFDTLSVGPSSNSFAPLKVFQGYNLGAASRQRILGHAVYEFRFSSDGTKVFVVAYPSSNDAQNPNGNNNAYFARYDLSSAWDVSTAVYHSWTEISPSYVDEVYTFDISSDGQWIIYSNTTDLFIAQMTTPYDLSTLGTFTSFASVNGGITASEKGIMSGSWGASAVRFNSNGTSLYVRSYFTTDETAYVKVDLPSAYTLGPVEMKFPNGMYDGGTLDDINLGDYGAFIVDINFEKNGEKFYVTWNQDGIEDAWDSRPVRGNGINEYTLSTPYDISTASITYNNTLDLTDPAINFSQGVLHTQNAPIVWNADGKSFYLGQGLSIAKYRVT